MKRYGKDYQMPDSMMDIIATYMDDQKRESIHIELAPCSPEEFLKRYVQLDPDFEELLLTEFGIEL